MSASRMLTDLSKQTKGNERSFVSISENLAKNEDSSDMTTPTEAQLNHPVDESPPFDDATRTLMSSESDDVKDPDPQKKKKMRHKKLLKLQQQQQQQGGAQTSNGAEDRPDQPNRQRDFAARPGKKRMRSMRFQHKQEDMTPMTFGLMSARNAVFTGSVLVTGAQTALPEQANVTAPNDDQQYLNEEGDAARERILKIVTAGMVDLSSPLIQEPQPTIYVQPLLVLDLNGILCHRLRMERAPVNVPLDAYRGSVTYVARTPIIPRTDLHEFLYYLDHNFCLGVWTSAKNKTAMALIKSLFPPDVANRLLFVWAQHHCDVGESHSDSESGNDDSGGSRLFEKDLSKVWKEFPLWNANNTLLMDDSPEKCTQWHENAVHPPALHGIKADRIADGQYSDEANERRQWAFFEGLVDFWKRNSSVQTWDDESGDVITYFKRPDGELTLLDSTCGMAQYLKENAVGHMGWK